MEIDVEDVESQEAAKIIHLDGVENDEYKTDLKEIEDEEVRADDTSPTDQLYYEEEYDENAFEAEEIKPPANFTDNLDTVEFGIGNVHLGEEESSPNPYHILLIPSRTNVPSPFDPTMLV